MPPLLQTVVEALSAFPTLYKQMLLPDLVHFINLMRLLKPYIILSQSFYVASPPDSLTQSTHAFISASLRIQDDTVKLLWEALKHYLWELEYDEELHRELGSQYIPYFLREGISRKLSTYLYLLHMRHEQERGSVRRESAFSIFALGSKLQLPVVPGDRNNGQGRW